MKGNHFHQSAAAHAAIALVAILFAGGALGGEEAKHANAPAKASGPGAKQTSAAPVLVNVTRGKNDLHAASMGLGLALSAAKAGRQTVVFLNVQAAAFAAAGLPTDLRFEDFPPIRQLVGDLVASGAKVYVCGHCAKVCKVDTGKLVPGVLVAGHGEILEAVPPHAVSFSY